MKVLIIEDDLEIVEFVSIALEVGSAETNLISAYDGQTGIDLIASQSPEVVILDLGLPDINGFEVLKQIRLFSEVPVIIISVRGSESDIVKGLGLGADEYIVKPFGQLELLARLQAVLRRHRHSEIDSPITRGPLLFKPSSGQLTCGSMKVLLTRTEGLIMHRLMSSAGCVVSYSELAETVWGVVYPDATNTLRVYIRRLRAKIETDPQCCIGFIHSRPGIGYLFEVPDQV